MTSKTGGKERRRHERVKLDRLKQCHDLSEGGLYMLTDRPRRLGSLVNFELKLEGNDDPIRGRGRVVRIIHQAGAADSDPPGMAIEFVEMNSADRDRIRNMVSDVKKPTGGGKGSGIKSETV